MPPTDPWASLVGGIGRTPHLRGYRTRQYEFRMSKMHSDPQGRWSFPRRLILVGALLLFVAGLAMLILDFVHRRKAAPLIVAVSFGLLLGVPILYAVLRAKR